MQIDIIQAAEIIGAISLILSAIIGGYKLYDSIVDKIDGLERRVTDLETQVKNVKSEDAIVIFALRACLDGLHQQGCNGKVTEAIERIDKYINKAAHRQD